jgi:hypothetical protein
MLLYHFGNNKVQIEYIKLNTLLSLVINFFLGRSGELNKTLTHHPRPTPSAEAPGGGVGLFTICHAAESSNGTTLVMVFG